MPVDAEEYARTISVTGFINSYYQVRDVLSYRPRRVLIVGVGTGLEPLILRQKFGLEVTTFDVDERFRPDCVGSVHDMNGFRSGQFDVVVASHVLEHLPFRYFDTAVSELARVATHAVVYLPFGGRNLSWRFVYAQRVRKYMFGINLPPLRRIDGESPALQAGHHYWEIGYRGFSLRSVAEILGRHFTIDTRYHNQDWTYSLNFLLTSRNPSPGGMGP